MMYKNNFVAVIKCNGKILRERNGEVYLPFGTEYSILLKNKDANRALVVIEVDGENVLDGHQLIVDGNDTKEIKGFMRDMNETNRFKFIHKTKEIQKHRGDRLDDGLVRITYQFERSTPINLTYPNFRHKGRDLDNGFVRNSDFTWNSSSSISFGTVDTFYNSVSCSNSKSFAPNADEGITVKGQKINQQYQYGHIGLLESAIHTIVLHLKGATNKRPLNKPITVKTKLGCSTCGRKNKSTNKFCYNCGTYLN